MAAIAARTASGVVVAVVVVVVDVVVDGVGEGPNIAPGPAASRAIARNDSIVALRRDLMSAAAAIAPRSNRGAYPAISSTRLPDTLDADDVEEGGGAVVVAGEVVHRSSSSVDKRSNSARRATPPSLLLLLLLLLTPSSLMDASTPPPVARTLSEPLAASCAAWCNKRALMALVDAAVAARSTHISDATTTGRRWSRESRLASSTRPSARSLHTASKSCAKWASAAS